MLVDPAREVSRPTTWRLSLSFFYFSNYVTIECSSARATMFWPNKRNEVLRLPGNIYWLSLHGFHSQNGAATAASLHKLRIDQESNVSEQCRTWILYSSWLACYYVCSPFQKLNHYSVINMLSFFLLLFVFSNPQPPALKLRSTNSARIRCSSVC